MEVRYYDFCKRIANDEKIEFTQKIKVFRKDFPLKNGVTKVNATYYSIIVDKEGNEFPYMLEQYLRNDSKLIDFDYIYRITQKSLTQILEETGVNIKSEKCKICEGGGWYRQGNRYFYKDIFCEV